MWLSLRSIAALLLTVVAAGAFVPALNRGTKVKCLNMAKPAFMLEINQAFGILALGSVLAFQVPPASAASQHALQSSSVYVSEVIRTLDFSMPSYDKLSDAKASVANVDGLAVEPLEQEQAPKPSVMSSFLPSMSKKGPDIVSEKKDPKEKKVEASRKSAMELIEDKNDEKITIVDMSLPSYTDSTASKMKSSFSF